MDLICTRCGEPWEMYYVLHEEPDGFQRTGGVIRHCPCCPAEEPDLTPEQRHRLDCIDVIAE